MSNSNPHLTSSRQEKRYFCTLFDSGYLFKGVVMLTSLKRHCPEATVYVLCLDEMVSDILNTLHLEGCVCIPLPMVETEALLTAKHNRNVAEYCWTLSSCFTAWLIENRPEVDLITYLDADLMFFSSPEALFEEMRDASVGIMEHRFIPRLLHLESKGRFCVEWVSFRRDDQGLACLFKWRDQCLEWCYDRLEDGRMGDQKYLDSWPVEFPRTHIFQHLGAGVAPWNYSNYLHTFNGNREPCVGGATLIFFHFHQFQLIDDGTFYRMSPYYSLETPPPEHIYNAYEVAMRITVNAVQLIHPGFSSGLKSRATVYSRKWVQTLVPRVIKELLKKFIRY